MLKMKKNLIQAVLLLCCLAGCSREEALVELPEGTVQLSLTLEEGPGAKSSAIADENLLTDLNIWIFSSSGTLRDSHYLKNLSIRSSGKLSFSSEAGSRSRIVLIGNAGRRLTAPEDGTQSMSLGVDLPHDGSGRILFVGEGFLVMQAEGFSSSVTLFRAMARIALGVCLSESLTAAGAVLGRDVRISSVRLRNCPQSISFVPMSASNSIRSFKAGPGTVLCDGDYLSPADISRLHAGKNVYLYSLPNFSDLPYSDGPGGQRDYASYVEMCFESDALPDAGPGTTLCRFYASDGARIGLYGGNSYGCLVTFSNNAARNEWRKEDYRFTPPGTILAGTRKEVELLGSGYDPDSLSFSLSSEPGVLSDGCFRLGSKLVSGGCCRGVEVVATGVGEASLYVFGPDGHPRGQLSLVSEYPLFRVADVCADVCGTEHSLELLGLEEAYADRASDELFNSLYSVSDIAPEGEDGRYFPGQFIYVDLPWRRLHVKQLSWDYDGITYWWDSVLGQDFGYRVTLACGISSTFNVKVVDGIVGPLASSLSFGEVVNTSEVPSPLPAVSALDGRDIVIERSYPSLPEGLDGEWPWNGWASWYGGSILMGGTPADDYLTVSGNTLRWEFDGSVTQRQYGGDIPVYIGKLNPWCYKYVRACVGTYSSSKYIPVGMEYGFYQYAFNAYGGLYAGMDGYMEVCSLLVFREHDSRTRLSVGEGLRGDTFSHYVDSELHMDHGSVNWVENGRRCYAIAYNGDIYYRFNPIFDDSRDIASSYAFASALIWQTESRTEPWNKYAATAYGGNGSYNRWIYLYCPYNSVGVYAAGPDGRVSAKGEVYVHLWSVSQKAVFDYHQGYDWTTGGSFTPPWR